MIDQTFPATDSKKIRLITKTVTTAIKIWLRTQLTQVSEIDIEIAASDRQLLSGCIPKVSIFAINAVYQGLHITRIQLSAENIQVNLRALLRGKPLQLLETVPVIGELVLEEKDLNQSLSSELLLTGVNDVLNKILPESWAKSKPLSWQKITVDYQSLILSGVVASDTESISERPISLDVYLSVELLNFQTLQLKPIKVLYNRELIIENYTAYPLNLGSDVNLQELILESSQILCSGGINVNP